MRFLLLFLLAMPVRAQLGPCAVPVGPLLPDLIVAKADLKRDVSVGVEFVDSNSCLIAESCVGGVGDRQLLRFTTTTPNVGATALYVGSPSDCSNLFHFSECHGHYHLEHYGDYRLWRTKAFKQWSAKRDWNEAISGTNNTALLEAFRANGDLVEGRKQGFCMIDSTPYPPKSHPKPAQFDDCIANQGISAGWADSYSAGLDCQFIDVTGVAPGHYVLEVEVNPDRILPESNYRNNSTHIRVKIPALTR